MEKGLTKKIFIRSSFSSDFKKYPHAKYGYKVGFGGLYNFLTHKNVFLKTGLEIGIRHIPSHIDALKWPTGDLVPVQPLMTVYSEVPVLIQFCFLNQFSIDFGLRTLFQRESELLDNLINLPSVFNSKTPVEHIEFAYHVGLRYTFGN